MVGTLGRQPADGAVPGVDPYTDGSRDLAGDEVRVDFQLDRLPPVSIEAADVERVAPQRGAANWYLLSV